VLGVLWSAAGVAQTLEFQSSISQQTHLAGVNHAAWSPDGAHLYAVAEEDDTLIQFLPAADGSLAFGQVLRDGVDGVEGLEGATAVALSPTGNHVYVASAIDDAVAVFSRDGSSGELTFVETLRDGIGGVDGLDGAAFLAVSPDGAHVYVASDDDDAVAVFARNAGSGALSFVQAFRRPADLGSPVAVAISPDGASVYAIGATTSSLVVLDRDGTSGMLSFVEVFEAYLFGTQDPNEIIGMFNPTAVVVSADGAQVYIASPFDDTVLRFDRNGTTGALTYVEILEDGVGGVSGLDGAAYLAISPDGANVYVAARTDDALTTLNRNGTTGALSFADTDDAGGEGLDFVETVVVSPDGSLVHGVSSRDRSLVAFTRDGGSGALSFSAVRDEPAGDVVGLSQIRSLSIDPGGTHIYTAGAEDDAIGVFNLDPSTYSLRFIEAQQNGVDGVRGLTDVNDVLVSPDRRHVYAVSQVEGVVASFNVIGAQGQLQFGRTTSAPGIAGAAALVMSADGRHLYVAGRSADSIVVFHRDLETGHLVRIETQTNGENGISGMNNPDALALSPDGTLLLVAPAFSSNLVAFSRDPQSGRLLHEPVSIAKGFGSAARRILFSPDGLHIFVITESPQRVLVFSIDFSSGALVLTGIQDLEGIGTGVTISEDGSTVTVTDADTSTVQTFARDPGTGLLSLADTIAQGEAGASGLSDPASILDVQDGLSHVVVADRDGSLAVLTTAPAPVPGPVDIELVKIRSDSFPGLLPGETRFVIDVSNKRTDSSAAVQLVDSLPAGAFSGRWAVIFAGGSSLSGNEAGDGDLNLSFQLFPNDPSSVRNFVTLTYTIDSSPNHNYLNTATATAEGDINQADNQASAYSQPNPIHRDGFEPLDPSLL
jgi:6-phosphogluconolactonase (cycloisomerase 2 family)